MSGGKLIVFDEMRHRQSIDLIGGTVEVDTGDVIYRGELREIQWWSGYPKRIAWTNHARWSDEKKDWTRTPDETDGYIPFKFESIEYFNGPSQLCTGELFFTAYGTSAITIFPCECEVPHVPAGEARYRILRACLEPTSGS